MPSKKILFFHRFLALIFPLVMFESCCVGPVLTPSPLPETKIIDMHCHTAGIGAGNSGCFISKDMQESYKFDIYLEAFGVNKEQVDEHGDALIVKKLSEKLALSQHVDSAIVLAMDGVINEKGELDRKKTEVYIPNDFVFKETNKYPNLHFGASINPYRKDAIERLENMKAKGCKLIKWLPSIMNIDPSDKKIIPFYKKMAELKLPLLSHTGDECSFTHAHNTLGDPALLELPLTLGVTVIAAHVATTGKNEGEDNFKRLVTLFNKYPHLYADISSLTQINKHGHLSDILKIPRIHKHLLYGSDFPLISTPLVSSCFFPLRLSPWKMIELGQVDNPWDHDVLLKQSLGLPTEIFARSRKLFFSE